MKLKERVNQEEVEKLSKRLKDGFGQKAQSVANLMWSYCGSNRDFLDEVLKKVIDEQENICPMYGFETGKKVESYGKMVDDIIKKSDTYKASEEALKAFEIEEAKIIERSRKAVKGALEMDRVWEATIKSYDRICGFGDDDCGKEPKERKFKVGALYPMRGCSVDYVNIVKYTGLIDGTHIFKEWKENPDVIHINPNCNDGLSFIGKRIKFK